MRTTKSELLDSTEVLFPGKTPKEVAQVHDAVGPKDLLLVEHDRAQIELFPVFDGNFLCINAIRRWG